MNNLPIEILFSIFKNYLTINDLLNCRLVCKFLKSLSDDKRLINELIISDNELNDKNWFYTNKSINYLKLIEYSLIKSLNLIYDLKNNLKRFYLECKKEDNLDFLLINSFNQLEELDLSIDFEINETKKYKLKLDQLKICKINYHSEYGSSEWAIKLLTPNLIALFCNDLILISIKGLKKLKYLEINYHYATKLPKLKELEYFKCNRITVLNDNFLLNFPNLKKLYVNLDDRDIDYCDDELYVKFKDSLNSVLDHKIKLKRLNLKIYLYYVQILDKDQLDEFSCNISYMIRYLNLLDDNVPIENIGSYEEFLNSLPDNQLERENFYSILFTKFKNITSFHSNQSIDNPDHFKWFLAKNERINHLSLYNSSLDQSFYDNLIDYLPKLNSLTIHENEINLDYNFIFNLKLLKNFITNQSINNSIDLIIRILNELKYLSNLEFNIDRNLIFITKFKEHNQFKLKLKCYLSKPINNQNQIRKIFNEFNEFIDELSKIY